MKQKVIPILIVIAGFLLLAYPFLSNYLFEKSAGSTVESYQEKTDMMDQKIKEKVLDEARGYNENLLRSSIQLTDPFKTKKINGETVFYNNILNVDRSEIMGYVKIPCISVDLPIYHGTSAEVLERGIGHLAASSFPIGGESTHAVLTGHTGLSPAKLFTDLTEMKKGDLFFIHVLDKKLAYRVDRITVVKPDDTRNLQIIDGEDHVTLLTCTPYGVNDHRLLVRGKRTRYHEKEEQTKERPHHSQWMEVYKQAILIGLLIVFSLVGSRKMYGRIKGRKKK
ncbi:class C sortase [Anaerostipes hadrus]|uniref:class C sortase n=1 Tax=Anaerostipes hadrus TaxID=649756 RepID=UPI00157076AE|nr:class C sortase [Anaerostipes hadrus]MCB5440301.1 class C sortase [Anaerostipes hadrus]NSG55326.1 class C sortase [Anaerostipes hadrus]